MNAIYDVEIGVSSFCRILISYKVCCMFCNCVAFDLDWYAAIMCRQYFKGQFDNTCCCYLFAVVSLCEESLISLYVAIFFRYPKHQILGASFVHGYRKLS